MRVILGHILRKQGTFRTKKNINIWITSEKSMSTKDVIFRSYELQLATVLIAQLKINKSHKQLKINKKLNFLKIPTHTRAFPSDWWLGTLYQWMFRRVSSKYKAIYLCALRISPAWRLYNAHTPKHHYYYYSHMHVFPQASASLASVKFRTVPPLPDSFFPEKSQQPRVRIIISNNLRALCCIWGTCVLCAYCFCLDSWIPDTALPE